MSCEDRNHKEAVSPPVVNPLRRIGEGEVTGDTNSDSDSRRDRNGRSLRPKGSDGMLQCMRAYSNADPFQNLESQSTVRRSAMKNQNQQHLTYER